MALCRTLSVPLFLPRTLLRSLSPSLSRSPSLSTAHYIPIYRDSPAITRFLLLYSVRRPVGVANTSKATDGWSVGWCQVYTAPRNGVKNETNVSLAEKFRTGRKSRAARVHQSSSGARSSFGRLEEPDTHWLAAAVHTPRTYNHGPKDDISPREQSRAVPLGFQHFREKAARHQPTILPLSRAMPLCCSPLCPLPVTM